VEITVILDNVFLIYVLLIKLFDISDGLIYGVPPDLLGLHDLLHAENGRELLLDLVYLNKPVLKNLVRSIQARDR
jgi:hypothetical protein